VAALFVQQAREQASVMAVMWEQVSVMALAWAQASAMAVMWEQVTAKVGEPA